MIQDDCSAEAERLTSNQRIASLIPPLPTQWVYAIYHPIVS